MATHVQAAPLIKTPSTKTQTPGKLQIPISKSSGVHLIGAWLLELPWNLVLGVWDLQIVHDLLDQLPGIAKMLLGGEDVAEQQSITGLGGPVYRDRRGLQEQPQ